jgi:putative ABC transport system permease protein
MIKRNLTIAFRNIRKNGIYSIINIAGLSLGIAVVVLILFWVVDELTFDKFHQNIDRLYTVYEHQQYSEGQELFTSCTPFPLSRELASKYPEVEKATTYANLWNLLIKYENTEYKEGPVICTDSSFLDVFSYTIVEGNKNALATGNQVIITEELARLFFGNESPIGKALMFDNEITFSVGAVIAKPGANSSLNFKVLAPLSALERSGTNLNAWGNNWPNTTVLLSDKTGEKALDDKISGLCQQNGQPNTTLHLFPFKNEHLYSYSGQSNRIQYIYQFLGIALIIILIASINFINLSVSRAEQRRPEVGVRKVMGATKTNILKQFLFEKGIMIFFSILVGTLLVFLLLPLFQNLSGKNIDLHQIQNLYLVLFMTGVLLIVLGLSVIYPSVYLSSVNAIVAMKKSVHTKTRLISFKNLLVVLQFTLSIALISSSIIISKQINYVNNFDLGYNHSNLVYLALDDEARTKNEALKQEFMKISGVESITRSDKLPFWGGNSSWGHDWQGKDPENKVLICKMNVDNNYFKTMGIKLVDGTGFPDRYDKVLTQEEFTSPQVILNQEAIKRMGISDPVGKYFSPWGSNKGTIVGITEDFHYESLHSGVEPMLLLPMTGNPGYIIVRIGSGHFTQTLDEIKSAWSRIVPQTKSELGFFDDRLSQLYNAEIRVSGLFRYFTFVAIFISCIGLFGLSLFVIEHKRKEIGIRKVNGARILEVMLMLNQHFVQWVIMAFVIAVPLSYIVMGQWLKNFAYKTNISWWIFALAGLLALGIALLTVSFQSWKAANKNPVEALRYE